MNILVHILTLGMLYVPSYDKILHNVHNSGDMEYYLSYFNYAHDKSIDDQWRTPQESIQARSIDCEDFAILVYEVLTNKGYDCSIYGLYWNNKNTGHCIISYQKGTDYGFFSNDVRYCGVDVHIKLNEADTYFEYDWKVRRKYVRK